MDDNEMTKLCAQAMGLRVFMDAYGVLCIEQPDALFTDNEIYAPLHDDAQAMALVKRFDIVIERDGPGRERELFGVTLFPARIDGKTQKTITVRHAADLNRALVECCARMRLEKSKMQQSRADAPMKE